MPGGVRASPPSGFCYPSRRRVNGFESMRLPENTQPAPRLACKGYKGQRIDGIDLAKARKALIYKEKALFVLYIFND